MLIIKKTNLLLHRLCCHTSGIKISSEVANVKDSQQGFFFFIDCVFIVKEVIDALSPPSPFSCFPLALSNVLNAASPQLLRWPRKGSREGASCHCDHPSLAELSSVLIVRFLMFWRKFLFLFHAFFGNQ